MPLVLSIQSELDERSATAAADRAQRIYADASRDMSRSMSETLTRGAREGAQAVERMADDARSAYKRVGDATDDLKRQEQQLRQMREDGSRGIEIQAERVRRARRQEREAIREATTALEQYERAAENAATAGTDAAGGFLANMRGAASGAASAGGEFAEGFAGGFAGSGALMRLGAAGGPIGASLAGVAGLGLVTGKILADNIFAGMDLQQGRAMIQAQLGLTTTQAGEFGESAGQLYASNFGESIGDVSDAMATVAGTFGTPIGDALEDITGKAITFRDVFGADIAETTATAQTMIVNGLARDATEAFDMMTTAYQRVPAAMRDELPDILSEYGVNFQQFGFSGADAMGMIVDTAPRGRVAIDKLSDSMKEFSLLATDVGNKGAQDTLTGLGMSGGDVANNLLAGGATARAQIDQIVDGLIAIPDPAQQAQAAISLFGTPLEDLGVGGIPQFLATLDQSSSALQGFAGSTQKMVDQVGGTALSSWESAQRTLEVGAQSMQTSMADAFGPALAGLSTWVTQNQDGITGFFQGMATGAATAGAVVGQMAGSMVQNFGYAVGFIGDGVGFMLDGFEQLAHGTANVLDAVGADGLAENARASAEELGRLSDSFHGAGEDSIAFGQGILDASGRLWDFSAGMGTTGTSAQNTAAQIANVREQVLGLPTGHQIDINAMVTFTDQAGRAIDPSQLLGFNPTEFANAGDAQRARRGLPPAPAGPPSAGPVYTPTWTPPANAATGGGGSTSLPSAPVLPIQYSATAGMPAPLASATTRLDEVRHDVAEKEARVNQLEQSNLASADEIQKARNDLAKAQQDELAAEVALTDAKNNLVDQQVKSAEKGASALNQQADSLTQFAASIDQDFGVSKGLPGIAENITKFLANLAFAPVFGALTAQREAAGFGPGEAGSGLTGMLASTGAFGPGMVPVPSWARSSSASGSDYGTGSAYPTAIAGMPGGTPYAGVPIGTSGDVTNQPGLDLIRSMGLKGTTYASHTNDGAATDREVDVTDPSGGNGLARLAEFARQNPSLFEEFIYSDPNTGQKTGIRSGQLVGPGTDQPGYYAQNWAGHQDHAHIEPSKGGGLGFGDGPAYDPAGIAGGVPTMPTGGPGLAGAPSGIGGPRLGPVLPLSAGQAAPSESATGGRPWAANLPPSEGIGIGGGVIGMAGSMAGGMGGGMGAAGADLAMQLIGRGIGAAGQYVGNAVSAGLETFLPNGSALGDPSSSWGGRILGAVAGVKPALPNTAGALGGEQNPNMAEAGKKALTPAQAQAGADARAASGGKESAVGRGGDKYEINVTNNRAKESGTGRDIQNAMMANTAAKAPMR